LRQYSFAKRLQSQNVNREKLRKALSYTHKMLVKLTPRRQHDKRLAKFGLDGKMSI